MEINNFLKVCRVTNAGDLEQMSASFHPDFFHIKELSMQTKDEYLEEMQDLFANGFQLLNAKLLFENEDAIVFQHRPSSTKGESFRITVHMLLKDGLIWRMVSNRVQD